MKSFSIAPLAKGIAAVLYLMRNEPASPMLARAPKPTVTFVPRDAGKSVADRFVKQLEKINPHKFAVANSPALGKAMATAVADTSEALRAKPKRIRSRHKPLTVADLEIGGEYVPKRGNQFSPNLFVRGVGYDYPDGKRVVERVIYSTGSATSPDVTSVDADEFLARAARRVLP